jgi:hypothetical protein
MSGPAVTLGAGVKIDFQKRSSSTAACSRTSQPASDLIVIVPNSAMVVCEPSLICAVKQNLLTYRLKLFSVLVQSATVG